MAKNCRSCQTRKVGTGNPGSGPYAESAEYARSVELCRPCATEAGWENMHSDDDHDAVANGGGDPAEYARGQIDLDGVKDQMKHCWICNPELDRAAQPATERQGTSRLGMVITVPIRAAAKAKAATVVARLGDSYATSVRTVKGVTTLKASQAAGVGVLLRWDAQGRFLSGEAGADGTMKKVRNVAEAYRVLGA